LFVPALWQMRRMHTDTLPGTVINGYTLDNDFERSRFRLKAGCVY
jgi:hypothetical protein